MKRVRFILSIAKAGKLILSTIKRKLKSLSKIRKLRKLKNQNRKNLRIFDSCDNLPAWRFFKTLKTNDLRYLLNSVSLPEYDTALLEPVWDQILKEYDQIKGELVFEEAFLNALDDVFEISELNIMRACLNMMMLGDERALKHLEETFGITYKSITVDNIVKLSKQISQLETAIKIGRFEETQEEKTESFIRAIVSMSNILKRTIDKDRITIAEFIYLNNDCSEIIKAQKKNGRTD